MSRMLQEKCIRTGGLQAILLLLLLVHMMLMLTKLPQSMILLELFFLLECSQTFQHHVAAGFVRDKSKARFMLSTLRSTDHVHDGVRAEAERLGADVYRISAHGAQNKRFKTAVISLLLMR